MKSLIRTTPATTLVFLGIMLLMCGTSFAIDTPIQAPHKDYTPVYNNGFCGGNYEGACHDFAASTFLPETLGHDPGDEKKDWTNFCLRPRRTPTPLATARRLSPAVIPAAPTAGTG